MGKRTTQQGRNGAMRSPAAPTEEAIAPIRTAHRRVVALTGADTFLGRNMLGLLDEDPNTARIVVLDIAAPRVASAKIRYYDVDLTHPISAERRWI
jgi:UDP-glucose 4-epimerase